MTLHIVGAGGFGRETLDALMACGEHVDGFADDALAGQVVRGLAVVSPDALTDEAVVAVADPAAKLRLIDRLDAQGVRLRTVVHPRAAIAPETTLSDGVVVLANAYVSSDVRLGRGVHVNYNATIGHDARVGDGATVLPGANVAGSVVVGRGVVVGSNAAVLQGVAIGDGAVVGAGAVVVRDVPPGAVATGVPASW